MGVIVVVLMVGFCGVLLGVVWGVVECLGLEEDEVVKVMLSVGLIGVFIVEGVIFVVEVGGCMVECGLGLGMVVVVIV